MRPIMLLVGDESYSEELSEALASFGYSNVRFFTQRAHLLIAFFRNCDSDKTFAQKALFLVPFAVGKKATARTFDSLLGELKARGVPESNICSMHLMEKSDLASCKMSDVARLLHESVAKLA